jgi:hypothetical protein
MSRNPYTSKTLINVRVEDQESTFSSWPVNCVIVERICKVYALAVLFENLANLHHPLSIFVPGNTVSCTRLQDASGLHHQSRWCCDN